MGILEIFKKDNKPNNSTTENRVCGSTFLKGYTERIQNPKYLHSHEWYIRGF